MTPGLLTIRLTVNEDAVSIQVEPRQTLAGVLRDQVGLTGTNLGCEHGVCGACTVLLDGRTARSCTLLAVQAHGRAVTTVEGLAADGEPLHPVQQAFADHHALQCGFCTPGFLLTTIEYLDEEPEVDVEEIRERLAGNLCRCTGYHNIVAAVKALVERQADR
ncbi:MAG: (2Fe-2S)-binding protein [bacterium]|nr:(2Fe-2S)-binding protein [bacterium]